MLDYFKLWVLAERFMMPRLQNTIMGDRSHKPTDDSNDSNYTLGISEIEEQEYAELVSYAYKNSSKDSPLRKMSITSLIAVFRQLERQPKGDWIGNMATFIEDKVPAEVAVDILKEIIKSPIKFSDVPFPAETVQDVLVPVEDEEVKL